MKLDFQKSRSSDLIWGETKKKRPGDEIAVPMVPRINVEAVYDEEIIFQRKTSNFLMVRFNPTSLFFQ